MLGLEVKRLYRFEGDGPAKAICDVSIEDQFLVKGFRIVEGRNGLFVTNPRQQGKDGKWYGVAYPLTEEVKRDLAEVLLKAYSESTAEAEGNA